MSAHDPLAEFSFADEQGTQSFGRDNQRLNPAFGDPVDKRRWPTSR
jgi:hypothetical protein